MWVHHREKLPEKRECELLNMTVLESKKRESFCIAKGDVLVKGFSLLFVQHFAEELSISFTSSLLTKRSTDSTGSRCLSGEQ